MKMPSLIYWNAPAGRRFFGPCGLARVTAGATYPAFGKRRPVAALQKIQVEIVNPKLRRHQLVQQGVEEVLNLRLLLAVMVNFGINCPNRACNFSLLLVGW